MSKEQSFLIKSKERESLLQSDLFKIEVVVQKMNELVGISFSPAL